MALTDEGLAIAALETNSGAWTSILGFLGLDQHSGGWTCIWGAWIRILNIGPRILGLGQAI